MSLSLDLGQKSIRTCLLCGTLDCPFDHSIFFVDLRMGTDTDSKSQTNPQCRPLFWGTMECPASVPTSLLYDLKYLKRNKYNSINVQTSRSYQGYINP